MTSKFLHTLYILLQGKQGNNYIMKFDKVKTINNKSYNLKIFFKKSITCKCHPDD